jgi:hypothetical protein
MLMPRMLFQKETRMLQSKQPGDLSHWRPSLRTEHQLKPGGCQWSIQACELMPRLAESLEQITRDSRFILSRVRWLGMAGGFPGIHGLLGDSGTFSGRGPRLFGDRQVEFSGARPTPCTRVPLDPCEQAFGGPAYFSWRETELNVNKPPAQPPRLSLEISPAIALTG